MPQAIGTDHEDTAIRRAYLVWLGVTVLVVVVLWALARPTGVELVLSIAVVVAHGILFVGVWRRLVPLRVAGPLIAGVVVLILLFRLLAWVVGPLPGPGDTTGVVTLMSSVGVLFPLMFLVFGTRTGGLLSLAVYGVFSAATIPLVVRDNVPGPQVGMVGTVAVVLMATYAITITLLWVLASRLEKLVAARTRIALLARQATTDPLTGVANRRRLDDELERMIAQSRRYQQDLAVVMLDLDRFKAINDSLGHDEGDRVLVELAERLRATVREADVLGRWGGEEFLLLAPHTDIESGRELAERCRQVIDEAPVAGAGRVTASFGVAALGSDDDARALMRRADLALYTAKREGRNRVVALADLDDPDFGTASEPRPIRGSC